MKIERLLIIGCGGIGSHLAPVLIRYINSMNVDDRPKEIVFVDGDKYEESNAGRQEFAASLTNQNKADAQAEMFAHKYPNMEFFAFEGYVGTENVAEIIPEDSVVFMCVDNHVCRRVVSAHCQALKNSVIITGCNELTDGNVQMFIQRNGEKTLPAIEERHPEIMTADDGDRSTMSCEEIEKLPSGGQIIFANATAANIMGQMFWRLIEHDKADLQEVYFDILNLKSRGVSYGS